MRIRQDGDVNVACGRSITLNELIRLLSEIIGRTITPTYVAPRLGDVRHSLADISKARSLGYKPHSKLKKELEETIKWFKVKIDLKIKNKTACIAVIGLGYVGLPTAVNFAENGFSVIGVNRTQSKVDLINAACRRRNLCPCDVFAHIVKPRYSGCLGSRSAIARTSARLCRVAFTTGAHSFS